MKPESQIPPQFRFAVWRSVAKRPPERDYSFARQIAWILVFAVVVFCAAAALLKR